MSAPSGWYPDPGGGPGLYRFWDGRAWSAAVSPTPSAAPPLAPSAAGAVPLPVPGPPRRRGALGWLLALVAVLAVVLVVVVLSVRQVVDDDGPAAGAGQPTTQVCPTPDNGDPEP